ncbi:MAG: right-handed parallel beta-helix repeat-containing protein, partial [Pirellulaceae bacterium]|nr:right-handed parallel beta-helix repeat-containing protein [Pirellulaceae bacterium]
MRNLTILLRLTFFAIFAVVLAADANATNYYVRTSGNDDNNGLSAGQAFKTIEEAADVAGAGDTVYVGAGTYTDEVEVENDGTSANPIRFEADSSGAQTGDAGDVIVSEEECFEIDGNDYIEIVGFIFDGEEEMVSWEDSLGGLLQNCEFRNGEDPILIKNASVTVDNCYIHDNDDSGIEIDGSSSNVRITNCRVQNNTKKGIVIKNASQIVIEDTICSDNGDHGMRLEADGSVVSITRCIMQRNKDGMHVHPKSDSPQ